MKNFISVLFVLILLGHSALSQSSRFSYLSPKPNSFLVSGGTNIILRCMDAVDRSSVTNEFIRVTGSLSGLHTGKILLADDERTIIFNPINPFAGSETVTVEVLAGIMTKQNAAVPAVKFKFTTMSSADQPEHSPVTAELQQPAAYLPAPPITIDSVNNPSPGYIFLATWDRNTPLHKYANYLFILDHMGKIIDSTRVNGAPFDFQMQPNGRLSYGLGDYAGITPGNSNLKHYVLDSSLAIIDSFQMKNGYLTDFHDFILLPNGHGMLMSYHTVTFDMSTIVPGGKPDALVVINIFQEQDAQKNVVFEWRDIDYIPITDTDLKLTDPRINPSTMNAFELDRDGTLLFSFRNHSDIMKVSRETGEIIWKFGGLKNQFTFINEHAQNAPNYFARQHDIHRLSNGNVSLFDNGEFHAPWYSRAAEYALDEKNMTATLVSEYRYPTGDIRAQAAGNAQRLLNGGWFTGFGILDPSSPVMRNIVESHADGTTAFELSLPTNVVSYRTSKHPWRQLVRRILVSNAEILQGNTYSFNKNGDTTGISIRYDQLNADTYNSVQITRVPFGPVAPEFITDEPNVSPVSLLYAGASIVSHSSEIHVSLPAFPEIHDPANTSIFIREYAGQGIFVELPTVYDSTAKELIAVTTKFGEIIFGRPDGRQAMAAPLLIEPRNRRKVAAGKPLMMKWGGRGLVQSFRLQIAHDSLFTSVIVDTVTTNSFVQKSSFLSGMQYFWRVRAHAGAEVTAWSPVWNFEPSASFVTLLTPNGGEIIPPGQPLVIRWDTNITDSVKVYLLRGMLNGIVIGKTNASNRAFQWSVGAGQAVDSTYKIVLVPYSDSLLADTSDAVFTITNVVSVDGRSSDGPNTFSLSQNYPNPFNPSTTIRFSIPSTGNVSLTVYDVLGKPVSVLVNRPMQAGEYTTQFNGETLPSGMYFCTLQAGSQISVLRMMLIK